MRINDQSLVVIGVSVVVNLVSVPALAAPSGASGSDVVVKKNADGTVEVSDAPGATQQAAGGQPRIRYRLKNSPGVRRINGVSVRQNPDGSIETIDSESAPTPIHTTAARKHTTKRTSSTSTTTTKKKSTH